MHVMMDVWTVDKDGPLKNSHMNTGTSDRDANCSNLDDDDPSSASLPQMSSQKVRKEDIAKMMQTEMQRGKADIENVCFGLEQMRAHVMLGQQATHALERFKDHDPGLVSEVCDEFLGLCVHTGSSIPDLMTC